MTIAVLKYKDDQGVVQTVDADIEYTIELIDIPEEFEWTLTATDDVPTTVVTSYVGPAPKRN